MTEVVAAVLAWLVPALVVFGVTALAVAVLAWALHRARRSPRARAAAERERASAGAELVRLDDAVAELDLEVGLSGALYGGDAPASLRRARLTAQHARDDAFDVFRAISSPDALPRDVRRGAARIRSRCASALAVIDRARAEHSAWMGAHVSAAEQVGAAGERLRQLRTTMGDPRALVAELSSRFDEDEWKDAAATAHAAVTGADDAERHLAAARILAADPSRSATAELAAAERALRSAAGDARALEEAHRLVLQAAQALPGEFDAAHAALRQAAALREHLPPIDADRLGGELRTIGSELEALEGGADRRPTYTVDRIARLRDRLDLAVGDARTAQQRIRGARTALPGTLAAARTAIARAESAGARSRPGADARARLASAQHELAAARQASDPVAALDAARRALRDAEDAQALATHDRMTGA